MNRSKVHRLVKLDADENVVKIIKQKLIKYWASFIMQVLFIVGGILAFFYFDKSWVYWLAAALLVLVVLWISVLWYKWNNTVLIITNNRLVDIDQASLWRKQVAMVDLSKIEEVRVGTHLLTHLFFKYGQIEVFLPNSNLSLQFDYVQHPDKIQELIYQLQKKYNNYSEESLSVETKDLVEKLTKDLEQQEKADLIKLILAFRQKMGLEKWGSVIKKNLNE